MKAILSFAVMLITTAALSAPFPSIPDGTSTVTTPHYMQKKMTLGPGAISGAIGVPASMVPVQMIVSDITSGNRGVGQATLLRPDSPDFVEWVGFDIASNQSGTGTVSQGYSNTVGQHIVWADFNQAVDVEVAGPTSVRIHNGLNAVQKVVITFIW